MLPEPPDWTDSGTTSCSSALPKHLADTIAEWFLASVVDGLNLMPDFEPSGIEAFVEHVVPILRRRGLFRREYQGTTLRDHLGLPRPLETDRRRLKPPNVYRGQTGIPVRQVRFTLNQRF